MARRRGGRARRRGKGRARGGGLLRLLLGTRWGRRFVGAVNVVVLGAGTLWYWQQPVSRQEEIRLLVTNYLRHEKEIEILDLAFDLYQYYYGDEFVATDFNSPDGPLFGGVPRAAGLPHRVRILENTGYLCGYSDTLRSPVWVAYRLFDKIGRDSGGERPDGFRVDSRTLAKVHSDEFTRSGFDRGHLAPNFGISRCYGEEAQLETFLMSNIVPQKHEMNAGLWRFLEERSALNYAGRFGEVWVITGPVFSDSPQTIGDGVPVPIACFKILIDRTEGKFRAQSFLIPQDAKGLGGINQYMVSIDKLERLTRLDFLAELADDVEAQVEARTPSRPW